jgi:Pentapeptide repeats (8 copies)
MDHMPNDEHVRFLKQGVAAWNAWRNENRDFRPHLFEANLVKANLRRADLSGANLWRANLRSANLRRANLFEANLFEAELHGANLGRADLSGAYLYKADLRRTDLRRADLSEADLYKADLSGANLNEANLRGADLDTAQLVNSDLTGADLTGCRIYGVSAWGLKLEGAKQQNLVITPENEPAITVDNIEVAQFIYLMLHNQKIRDVIDTITSKAVLILGRFTDERKAILNALREELRKRNLLPILFDFAIPASRDVTETIKTLASLARFVIADVTDATEVRVELHKIAPDFTSLPIQLILLRGHAEFVSLSHLMKFPWVSPIFEYDDLKHLLADLGDKVIRPAEQKVLELRG